MANFTVKVKADPYFNAESLADLSAMLEDHTSDLEDGKKHNLNFSGEHFTATITVEPKNAKL